MKRFDLKRPDLTIILPTYNRPELLQRCLSSIDRQEGYMSAEILVYGDNCPVLDSLELTSKYNLYVENLPAPNSGNPARAINLAIDRANSDYTIFVGDDDLLLPRHFQNYLSSIRGTEYDWVYHNSWISTVDLGKDPLEVAPKGILRDSAVAWGRIGHSEIIIKTDLLKIAPIHVPDYGHDWVLIQWLAENFKYNKSEKEATYIVNWDHNRFKNYFT